MEPRKISWIPVVLCLLLSQSADSFFFPPFLRRQFSRSAPAARGQVGGVDEQPTFRIINRPRATNTISNEGVDQNQNPNFQVPQALCLACGSFPWTPVAGKEQIITGSGSAGVGSVIPPQQPITEGRQPGSRRPLHQQQQQQQQQAPIQNSPSFFIHPNEYPVHQHLEVTKEPGNTVIINALGPDLQDGNRKPYAFSFGSPLNSAAPPKGDGKPPQEPPKFGGPIVLPYEQPKSQSPPQSQSQQGLSDIPRVPAASSLTSGYVQPPPIPYKPEQFTPLNRRPPPGIYGSNSPPFNQPPTLLIPAKQPQGPFSPQRDHPKNIAPITVGTILAAQQSFQIQPANLVYQEHTKVQQPQYFVPMPPRPPQQYHPQAQAPQSFKLPIISSNAGPSGTVTINQIPLHAVPNYRPPPPQFVPHFLQPQGSYNFPHPQQHQPQQPQYFQPIQQEQSPFPPQRSPKPGHSPVFFEPSQNNKYRVPEQQVPQASNSQGVGHEQEQQPQGQGNSYQGIADYSPPPQRPIPPARPYAPPEPSATYRPPITYHQTESSTITSPPPTYIPPRVPGQLFTSYAEEESKQAEIRNNNDLEEEPKSGGEKSVVAFPPPEATVELGPSGNNQVQQSSIFFPTNEEPVGQDYSFQVSSDFTTSGEPSRQPITIPNLLRIQPSYRFVDESPQTDYRQQFVVPVGQKGIVQGDEIAQPSINTQTREQKPENAEEDTAKPTPSDTISSTSTLPFTVEPQTNEYGTKIVQSPDNPGQLEGEDKRQEGQYGNYEIVPATQYDITHLFSKQGGRQGEKSSEGKQQIKSYPVPIPIPIPESELANAKSPMFIVGQSSGISGQELHGYKPYGTGNSFEGKSPTYFQYDPLPPSVVSALQHAQTTSLLTHQHHLSSSPGDPPKENTIYINSVPVTDDRNSPHPQPNHPRLLRPIAFDLNSGKQIQIQSNRNAEILSLKTVMESDAEGEQRKSIPVYTLQQESVLQPVVTNNENQGQDDQVVTNCQNTQQWAIPPPRQSEGSGVEGTQVTSQDSQSRFQGQFFVQTENQDRGVASGGNPGQNPYIFYYPSQDSSSVYWLNQQLAQVQAAPPQRKIVYGQEVEKVVDPEPTTIKSIEAEERPKSYLAKPVMVKWSKILAPKPKPMEASTAAPLQNDTRQGGENSIEGQVHPNLFGKDHIAQVEQVPDDDEKVESESKDASSSRTQGSGPNIVDEKYPVVLETGGGGLYEVVGPTTMAECITEATTTEGTTETYAAATTTVKSASYSVSPTFSPRIPSKSSAEDKGKVRTGSPRFPTGRPTISTFRGTTEETGVSASVHVPVYRPPHSISSILQQTLKSFSTPNPATTVEEIYKSHEMKELGSHDVTGSTPTFTSTTHGPQLSMTTNEDDEADDLDNRNNHIGEVATARKIASRPAMNSMKSDNRTTTRIVFSSQIIPTASPMSETSGSTSTKIIKTVRVRQRMRPANVPGFVSSSGQLRSRVAGGSSRVRVMTRTSASDYMRNHSEAAVPEGEILGEDEAKEVKDAHIEIKRV